MAAWDNPIAEIRRLERVISQVKALVDPLGDYRPYAVSIDGDVILAVAIDDLRNALGGAS